MKKNKYTIITEFDNNHNVIINGITKQFIVISKEKKESFEHIIAHPDDYLLTHPRAIKLLSDMGAIVNDDFNPKQVLINLRRKFIESREYKTTILPTFDCNYACWYCIQKHVPAEINQEKIDLIIKHIKKYLIENDIRRYVISWFGGEPLMQPDIIQKISMELLNFCNDNNIVYTGGITTNGALLTESTIKILGECKINYFQIAIDGDEKAHNKNKFDAIHPSSFALILTNICNLLRANSDAQVTLRLNYTIPMLQSKDLVPDITKYIPWELRNRIEVDLQRVWQVEELSIPLEELLRLQKELVENGFKLVSGHIFDMCYVDKKHYNMFYYDGTIEKCDHVSGTERRGYLNEDGDVVWKESPVFQNYDVLADDCVCSNCRYYPLCYNCCTVLRETLINQHHKVVCAYNGNHERHHQRIKDYCWRVMNNQQLKQL